MPLQYSQVDRKSRNSKPSLEETGAREYYVPMDSKSNSRQISWDGKMNGASPKSGASKEFLSLASSIASDDSSVPPPPKSGFHAPSVDLSISSASASSKEDETDEVKDDMERNNADDNESNNESEASVDSLDWIDRKVVIGLSLTLIILFGALVAFFSIALDDHLNEDAQNHAPTTGLSSTPPPTISLSQMMPSPEPSVTPTDPISA